MVAFFTNQVFSEDEGGQRLEKAAQNELVSILELLEEQLCSAWDFEQWFYPAFSEISRRHKRDFIRPDYTTLRDIADAEMFAEFAEEF